MPSRAIMSDWMSTAQGKEICRKEIDAKERWIKANRNGIWQQAMCPIQGRIQEICEDKKELLHKLMDSKDEYFKFCVGTAPRNMQSDTCCCNIVKDPCCDECCCDPTIPMKTPPEHVTGLIFEGLAKEGGGYKRYLTCRYNSGLPETRFCYPPTSNSEYAWRLKDSVACLGCAKLPRLNSIMPAFYRPNGAGRLCKADYAPYHFPRNYC